VLLVKVERGYCDEYMDALIDREPETARIAGRITQRT
jgi:hypothetical protein